MTPSLTLEQARRLAVRGQRLDKPGTLPAGRLLGHLGAAQIDSVNVLARAHYLPFFSRTRATRADVDRIFDAAGTTEYWGHEASLMSQAHRDLFGWRMRDWRAHAWGAARSAEDHPGLLEMVEAEAAAEPGTARQLEQRLAADSPRRRDDWGWNWSLVKRACEALFWAGRLTTTGRNASFERLYVPGDVPRIDDDLAAAELVVGAVRASGVADRRTIRDYFRLTPAITDLGITTALAAGELQWVRVAGRTWLAPPDLTIPRTDCGTALLSPFDSLLWDRKRVEQLFGFTYRNEIYTPATQRRYGYYVLPLLLDGQLVARVDLKADRKSATLLVRSAWGPARAAGPLAAELRRLADWLGLGEVIDEGGGDLRIPRDQASCASS